MSRDHTDLERLIPLRRAAKNRLAEALAWELVEQASNQLQQTPDLSTERICKDSRSETAKNSSNLRTTGTCNSLDIE